MTPYPSQLCTALWDSRSGPVVIQPGIEPRSVVTLLALRCSALDCCATREPRELLDIRTVVTHQHYDQEHDFPEFDPLFVAPRAIELYLE